MITVEEIMALVELIESEDSIDWGMLNISESQARELIVNSLVDQYHSEWSQYPESDRVRIMLATMAKLVVENFVLNVQLRQ